MTVFILINGRTRAICGAYSSLEIAGIMARVHDIDAWHIVERTIDIPPVQYA